MQPEAFDAFAPTYDADFSHTPLGQLLRRRVWAHLARFQPGERVLELACGTGEDALWLAQRGVHVTATDGSAKMVAVTQQKGEAAGISAQLLSSRQLSWQQLPKVTFSQSFDGAFSNFGGWNVVERGEYAGIFAALARLIKPSGSLILVPMGPTAPGKLAGTCSTPNPGLPCAATASPPVPSLAAPPSLSGIPAPAS